MYSNGIDGLVKYFGEKNIFDGFLAIFRSNLSDFGRFSPILTLKVIFSEFFFQTNIVITSPVVIQLA